MMKECPYIALSRDVLENTPPRPKRFPKGGDFAPRCLRDCPEGNLFDLGDVFSNTSLLSAVYGPNVFFTIFFKLKNLFASAPIFKMRSQVLLGGALHHHPHSLFWADLHLTDSVKSQTLHVCTTARLWQHRCAHFLCTTEYTTLLKRRTQAFCVRVWTRLSRGSSLGGHDRYTLARGEQVSWQ